MIRIISTLFLALASTAAVIPTVAVAQTEQNQKKSPIELAENAPDSYTVVRGDTLWGISGKFLKQPWRWPEVWRMNKEQIRNPHWIYPGQVILLDRNGPSLSLQGSGTGSGKDGRLQPEVYSSPADQAIMTIPMRVIEQFLSQPIFSDDEDDSSLPTVVGISNNRVIAGEADAIFAKGVTGQGSTWQIYRRAQKIKEPVTGDTLGYESVYVGKARLMIAGEGDVANEMLVTLSRQDINVGDRLTPEVKEPSFNLAPHPIAPSMKSRVASIYNSQGQVAGRFNIITLSKGKNDGMELGHVVALSRSQGELTYRGDGGKETYKLPAQRYGLALVFRVFNRLSYALVLDSSEPVSVGDDALAP